MGTKALVLAISRSVSLRSSSFHRRSVDYYHISKASRTVTGLTQTVSLYVWFLTESAAIAADVLASTSGSD
jgi:hypothetical protein